jgi:membrane protease YdiL (CAAX protease family)
MFKNYLRIQPVPVQSLLFLSFWCALMLVGMLVQPLYIKSATGIGSDQLQHFFENEIYKHPNVIFVSNTLFQIFTFLVPALVYAYLADPSPRQYLGMKAPGRSVQIAGVVVLSIGLIAAIGPITDWLKQMDLGNTSKDLDKQREAFIMTYLSSANGWAVLRSICLIALVPAICEELFFRGMVFKFAQSLFKKWWLSVLISAFLFAIFHTSISELVPIFLAGLVLGWVYYITSSIWMNILLHLLFNGLQVLIGVYSTPGFEQSLEAPAVVAGIFIAGLALTAAGIFFLYRQRTPLPGHWSVQWPPADNEERLQNEEA